MKCSILRESTRHRGEFALGSHHFIVAISRETLSTRARDGSMGQSFAPEAHEVAGNFARKPPPVAILVHIPSYRLPFIGEAWP